MRPLKRLSVSKGKSVRQFRSKNGRTQPVNLAAPMRGGIRL